MDERNDKDETPERGTDARSRDEKTRAVRARKHHQMISSYTILLFITVLVGVATIAIAQVNPDVTAARLSDIVMSPITGTLDGIEISLFLLIFGGCMGMVNKIGAIDAGHPCARDQAQGS